MENLSIYNQLSITPKEARKEIGAGRLKGFTDINPMWRIKRLTEVFGMCGVGWKYVITSKRLENGCKGQISAFVDIDLFVKVDNVWSDAIPGTGGSSFIADEKNGLYQSDECFKMALTDAISVSCKALGMSSDIYFEKDRSKYTAPLDETEPPKNPESPKNEGQEKVPQKPLLTQVQFDNYMKLEPSKIREVLEKLTNAYIIKPDWLLQLKERAE